MITATLKFALRDSQVENATVGYTQTRKIIQALHACAPDICPGETGWHGGVIQPGQKPVVFSDQVEMIRRLTAQKDKMGTPHFCVHLSGWPPKKRTPGRPEFLFIPSFGHLTVTLLRPQLASIDGSAIARLVHCIVDAMPVEFAFVDVYDNDPTSKDPTDTTNYASTFATFPHRQCLGWMAYVPAHVTVEQLPLAEEVIHTKDGTIIVAIKGHFDISNPEHIKRVNQIEMDMVDLGLLAVTDPSL